MVRADELGFDLFHEPLVLFGYLAAVTEHLELVTGVLVLPQRQTALVAKQATEVDVLSRGRLRLGIGVGLKADEYEALDAAYHDRGPRSEEQIDLLRALWGQELITYAGQWHTVSDGGLNPLPVQRPIPIWFGGHADAVVRRLARLGDGWIPLFAPDDAGRTEIEKMRCYAREAGRDPVSIGIESWITIASKTPDSWREEAQAWKALGATHLSVKWSTVSVTGIAVGPSICEVTAPLTAHPVPTRLKRMPLMWQRLSITSDGRQWVLVIRLAADRSPALRRTLTPS